MATLRRLYSFRWCVLLIFLGLAAYLRHFAFFLPSNVGDSTAYQSLAMKMNHGFLRDYNLFRYRMVARSEAGLADYVWEEDPKQWQSNRIRKIYHLPLHLQPPLYPTLIWISHGIFQHGEPYTSVTASQGRAVIQTPPWRLARAQFYAILIPFLCSMGTLVLVYLFCVRFFTFREGLLAVAMLATSPMDIAVGPKLYADSILTFFCFLSLFGFFRSLEANWRRSGVWATLAGLALGLAYLTKVTGVLFAIGPLIAVLLHPRFHGFERLIAPQIWKTGATAVLVALPWLYLMHRHYGTFMVNSPADPGNPWYRYVFSRPPKAYLFDLAWFAPPIAFGFLSGGLAWLKPRRHWLQASLLTVSLFYLGMFLVFRETGTAGVEDRYLMPIYPPLAILSAWGLVAVLQRIPSGWGRWLGYAVLWSAVLAMGWRSLQIGLNHSFAGLVIFQPLGY